MSLDSPDLRNRRQCCVSAIIASAIVKHNAGDWPIPKSGKSPLKPAHPRYPCPRYSHWRLSRHRVCSLATPSSSETFRRPAISIALRDIAATTSCAVAIEGVLTCCNLFPTNSDATYCAVTYIYSLSLRKLWSSSTT